MPNVNINVGTLLSRRVHTGWRGRGRANLCAVTLQLSCAKSGDALSRISAQAGAWVEFKTVDATYGDTAVLLPMRVGQPLVGGQGGLKSVPEEKRAEVQLI